MELFRKNILAAIDKDEDWLMEKLAEQGYSSSSEIFLADYLSGNVVINSLLFSRERISLLDDF